MGLSVQLASLLLLLPQVCLSLSSFVEPPADLDSAPYAEWAHYHWVWLSNDYSWQKDIQPFFDSWFDHDIPVGGLDIDSEWATGINDFVFNKTKFPDAQGLIDHVHSRGAHVILWATSMIDTDSPNFQTANESGFFIKNAFNGTSTLHWWHGDGCLLDYTNPKAVDWWHSQLDNVLDLGVDGFKTDGTDPFIMEYLIPQSSKGPISYREYADAYYGDFFNYTRKRNGPETLIMSRPVDSFPVIGDELSVYLTFSPHYVMFSGWVGDQDATFPGLQDALRNMIHSAWHNYTNFGSDIGGYRHQSGLPLGRTPELFTRWFQLGAFLPLMENGGSGEHRPWIFDSQLGTNITGLYRRFADAHTELAPYLLETGTTSYANGISSMRPNTPAPADLFILQFNNISDYGYQLGDNIFVTPVTDENMTAVEVNFPYINGGSWVDYFNSSVSHVGGTSVQIPVSMTYFPVFQRAGSIIPLRVTTDATLSHPLSRYMAAARAGVAPKEAPGVEKDSRFPSLLNFEPFGFDTTPITLSVVRPSPKAEVEQSIHRFNSPGAVARYVSGQDHITFTVSAWDENAIWHVRGLAASDAAKVVAAAGADDSTPQQELVRTPCPEDSQSLLETQRLAASAESGIWFSCSAKQSLAAGEEEAAWYNANVGTYNEVFVMPKSTAVGSRITIIGAVFE